MTKRASVALAVAASMVFAFGAMAKAADSNIGTWKLNTAKSRFNPSRTPTRQTLKIEEWGTDGVKFSANGADADGRPTHSEFQVRYDGTFVPVTGNPDANTLAFTRVAANTIESTLRLNGKQMAIVKIVVSNDGRTMTMTQTGTNAAKQDVHNTIVYDKQ